MTKIYSFISIGACALLFLGFQHVNKSYINDVHGFKMKSSSGPGAGFTGAPGEGNCTQCHSGSTLDGSTVNTFTISQSGSEVTEYMPDENYDLFLNLDAGSDEKGFQITALDENNQPAGEFAASSNTQLKNGQFGQIAGRKYVTHTSGTNSASGWEFSWTAPSDNVGEITFYVATNKTNSSNTSGGDMIYLAQYNLNTSAGLIEQTKENQNFSVGYNPTLNQLNIKFETENQGEMFLNLTDLNGKTVLVQKLGNSVEGENKQIVTLPSSISNGIFIANFFVDNKAMSAKVQIIK